MAKAKKAKSKVTKKTKKTVKTRTTRARGPKIGVFGGTFNPIHYGHLNSIETVQKELRLDQVWIVPAHQSPLRHADTGVDAEARVEMVKLTLPLLNQGQDLFVVKENEIRRGGVSYSVDTLKEFKKENKAADIYLIIGADQLEQFDRWKDYKNILKLAHLVVTTRPGSVLPEQKSEMPEGLRPLLKSFRNGKGKLSTGKNLIYVNLRDVEVSSSDIRRRLRHKENVASYTPSPVVEYIRAHKLYEATGGLIGDYEAFTRFCADVLNKKGALSIAAYDVRNIQQPTEFTLVGSGTSTRHTKALAENVIKQVKDRYGVHPQGTEGFNEGRWIVLDYGSLMVHLFYDYVRHEYRIEELWREGQPLAVES